MRGEEEKEDEEEEKEGEEGEEEDDDVMMMMMMMMMKTTMKRNRSGHIQWTRPRFQCKKRQIVRSRFCEFVTTQLHAV